MEVGLAITVGTVLAAGGVLAYMHARDAAGDAVAKQKVADLQVMIEDYFTRYNALPPLGGQTSNQGIRDMFLAARSDAMKSPWGGPVIDLQNQPIEGFDNPATLSPANTAKIVGGPDNNCPSDAAGERCGSRKNNLIYHRYQVPGSPPEVCDPCWQVWDAGLKAYVRVNGYSVSINKQGRSFFFVTSGRTAQ